MNSEPSRIISDIIPQLEDLGACRGDCLIVHSSFKALGLKGYSPTDVIRTLIEFLGEDGTLVMPTFTYSYAGIWQVRPFNPATTPGNSNGILTEALRQYPGARRSGHPTYSVAAIGRHSEAITQNMEHASALGIGSADSLFMRAVDMVNAVVARLKKDPAWLLCNNFTCEPCNRRKKRLREKGLI